MNHSIYSADRTTHVKIVVAALVASIGVAGFGIAARNTGNGYSHIDAHVTKVKARPRSTKFAAALPTS